jgi:hypothetical protein
MYHPAAALHQEKLRQTLEEDMRKLGTFLQEQVQQLDTESEPEDRDPEQLSLFS